MNGWPMSMPATTIAQRAPSISAFAHSSVRSADALEAKPAAVKQTKVAANPRSSTFGERTFGVTRLRACVANMHTTLKMSALPAAQANSTDPSSA